MAKTAAKTITEKIASQGIKIGVGMAISTGISYALLRKLPSKDLMLKNIKNGLKSAGIDLIANEVASRHLMKRYDDDGNYSSKKKYKYITPEAKLYAGMHIGAALAPKISKIAFKKVSELNIDRSKVDYAIKNVGDFMKNTKLSDYKGTAT
jgi:hypothetical protein